MINQSTVSPALMAGFAASNQLQSALISERQIAIHHHYEGERVVTSVVQAITGPEGLEWQPLAPESDTAKTAVGAYKQMLAMFNDGVGLSMDLPASFVANLAANYAVRQGEEPGKSASQGCVEVLRLFRTHPGQSEQAIIATLAMDGLIPNHAGSAYLLGLATQLIETDALLSVGLPESLVTAYESGDLNTFTHQFATELLDNPVLLQKVSNVDARTHDHMIKLVNELPVDTEGNFYRPTNVGQNKAVLLKSLDGLPTKMGFDSTVAIVTFCQDNEQGDPVIIDSAVMNAQELEMALLKRSGKTHFHACSGMVPDGHAAIIELTDDKLLFIDSIGNQHINGESFKALVEQFNSANVVISPACLQTLGPEDHTKQSQPSPRLG